MDKRTATYKNFHAEKIHFYAEKIYFYAEKKITRRGNKIGMTSLQ